MKRILAILALMSSPLMAGTLYVNSTGLATNSGSTDSGSPTVSLATVTISGSVITFPTGTNLSVVVGTAGVTQSSVFVKDATNPNQKIFWVTNANDAADTITVSVAPTGAATSSATIGGYHLWTQATIEGAIRAGDTVTVDDDIAAQAATIWTVRNAGDNTSGPVKMVGKSGVRPKLTTTNTSVCVNGNSKAGVWIENLEIIQQGASGNAVDNFISPSSIINVKISDAGGAGIANTAAAAGGRGFHIFGCEISGTGTFGIDTGSLGPAGYSFGYISGNYIHDTGSDGIRIGSNGGGSSDGMDITLVNNIIDTPTSNCINMSQTGVTTSDRTAFIYGNTCYGALINGFINNDADQRWVLMNNIFTDNGDSGSEYNINLVASSQSRFSYSNYNLFNNGGALGGGNTNGYTTATNDITTSPSFTNAAGGNFSLGTTSGAKAAGFPGLFLGGSTGYMDIGAVQRQEPTASGPKSTFIFGD